MYVHFNGYPRPCPSCGHCPHCGRGGNLGPYAPLPAFHPWQQPNSIPQVGTPLNPGPAVTFHTTGYCQPLNVGTEVSPTNA